MSALLSSAAAAAAAAVAGGDANNADVLQRKRLRRANDELRSRMREVVVGEAREVNGLLTRSHSSLCKSTGTFQDICRNIKVANEELTECSVELMNAGKIYPPFFSTGRSLTANGKVDQHSTVEQWEALAGGPVYHNYKEGLYQKYKKLLSGPEKTSSAKHIRDQIDRDIPRTPGFNALNKRRGGILLKNILLAYSLHDPQCGYVQGMAIVCAHILNIFFARLENPSQKQQPHQSAAGSSQGASKESGNIEERVFWMFSQIMTAPKYSMRRFFLPRMPQLHIACYQLQSLMASRLSRIAKHFDSLNIQCSDFLSGWLLTLFTSCGLPDTLLEHVWSCYLEFGYPVLISVSLGALACSEQIILLQDHDSCQDFLRGAEIWKAIPGPEAVFSAASRPSRLIMRDLDRLEVAYNVMNR